MQKQQFYSEAELWFMLETIVSTAQFLAQRNKYLGDLRPQNVMISELGMLKLVESGAVFGDKTGFQRAYFNKEKAYLAPELLPFLSENISNPPPTTQKSDIFSLGLTLLECSTLISAKSLYAYSKNGLQFNSSLMGQMLDQIPQLGYSSTWYRMVRELTKEKPDERPSLDDILVTPIPIHSLLGGHPALPNPDQESTALLPRRPVRQAVVEAPARPAGPPRPARPQQSQPLHSHAVAVRLPEPTDTVGEPDVVAVAPTIRGSAVPADAAASDVPAVGVADGAVLAVAGAAELPTASQPDGPAGP